jgi:hypothetical protein
MSHRVLESDATGCAWYDEFVKDVKDWELLFDDCHNGYSGWVYIVAKEPENDKYVLIDYHYGSCSGCDEFYDMTDEELLEEKERLRIYFTKSELIEYAGRWLKNSYDEDEKHKFFEQFLPSGQELENKD